MGAHLSVELQHLWDLPMSTQHSDQLTAVSPSFFLTHEHLSSVSLSLLQLVCVSCKSTLYTLLHSKSRLSSQPELLPQSLNSTYAQPQGLTLAYKNIPLLSFC